MTGLRECDLEELMIKNCDIVLILFGVSLLSTSANAQWLQWGGPSRNFKVAADLTPNIVPLVMLVLPSLEHQVAGGAERSLPAGALPLAGRPSLHLPARWILAPVVYTQVNCAA